MTTTLDKIERVYGWIALLIFAMGFCCLIFLDINIGIAILIATTLIAFFFGVFFQEKKRRKQEFLANAHMTAYVENRSTKTFVAPDIADNNKHKNILNKLERIHGRIALLIFAAGFCCLLIAEDFKHSAAYPVANSDFGAPIFLVTTFTAFFFIFFFQRRKHKKQETLVNDYMTAYVEDRSRETSITQGISNNSRYKNSLDKLERIHGRIALLIFAVGFCCLLIAEDFKHSAAYPVASSDFGAPIFLLTTFTAFFFSLFFQRRKHKKQEALRSAYRDVCAENRLIAMHGDGVNMTETHMSSSATAMAMAFSSENDSYLTSTHFSNMSVDDYLPAWESSDYQSQIATSGSIMCNTDGTPMCGGSTDIYGHGYGITS